MPYWLAPALVTLPVFLLSFLLAGTPWAWLILPRADRRDRLWLLTLGLALGAVLWTTGMFLLGTFLRITLAGTLLAGGLIAGWGWLLAFLQANHQDAKHAKKNKNLTKNLTLKTHHSLAVWQWLIVIGLVIAVLIRIFHTAYWPFTAYDPLWVYGYNGRLFLLSGEIPASMGYYPQHVPLTYTFGQLVWGGAINDHAARMAVVVFGLGSILAAYQLGAKLVSRRVGLLAAALWTFYPHHAQWARFGDLEVPLTLYFTLAGLLFLMAWRGPLSRPLPHHEGEETPAQPPPPAGEEQTPTRPPPPAGEEQRVSPSPLVGEGSGEGVRYAILSGLMLAGALWTKPTAGALVWGIGLVFLIEGARVLLNPHPASARRGGDPAGSTQETGGLSPLPDHPASARRGGDNPGSQRAESLPRWRGRSGGGLWRRFGLVIVVGLASAPIGGMWYIRNILLGHDAVTFPPAYWLTQAQRSGQELGWPLLILALLALYLLLDDNRRPDPRLLLPGLALLVIGALPSAGFWSGTPTHRLRLEEIAVMVVGGILYSLALWRWYAARHELTRQYNQKKSVPIPLIRVIRVLFHRTNPTAVLVVALVAPYFMTWFWGYSYHPRLAFAITPLQLLLVAWLLAKIAPRLARFVRPARRPVMVRAALLVLIVPGLWLTAEETLRHLDLPDDDTKHRASNYALFRTVEALREEVAAGPVAVHAPGALRLPFFFPEVRIDTTATGDLAALDDAYTHFVVGVEAENLYRAEGLIPSPARALPGRPRLAQRVHADSDLHFNYELYAVRTALRWVEPSVNAPLRPGARFDPVARLLGHTISGLEFWPNRQLVLTVYWRARQPTDADYTVLLHVLPRPADARPDQAAGAETPVAIWDHTPGDGLYPTYLWTPGEYVADALTVALGRAVPPGAYRVVAGLYDASTLARLPIANREVLAPEVATTGEVVILLDDLDMLPAAPAR